MTNLLKNAKILDEHYGLDEESIKKRDMEIKDWNRRMAKLTPAMIRSTANPPSDYDFKKLAMVEHYFKTM